MRFHWVMVVDGSLVLMADDEVGFGQCLGGITASALGWEASDHGRQK